ncbi:hypothetical protein M3B80_008195 [Micrococcus luteus]|nr:hypothetical protein [Micrococcus luteus]
MLTRVRGKAVVVLGAFALGASAVAVAPVAVAETTGGGRCQIGTCIVEAETPGAPGTATQPVVGNGAEPGGDNGSTPPKEVNFCEVNEPLPGDSIPYRCDVNYDPVRDCVWTTLSPQPAPPEGEDPTRGAWEECIPANTTLGQQNEIRWMVSSGSGTTTPAQAAVEVVEQMQLKGIEIGMVPFPKDQQGVGAVGLPAWMWVANPGDAQAWGPYSVTRTVDGVSVQATARPLEVTWDMGNGDSVVCTTAGTPYDESYGRQESPDCGYTWEKMGDYRVSAITTWSVEWTAGGESGVLETVTRSAQDVKIGEFQALNVRP